MQYGGDSTTIEFASEWRYIPRGRTSKKYSEPPLMLSR